jgi:hypothetical protein
MRAAEINAVTMFLVEHQNDVLPSAADVSAALTREMMMSRPTAPLALRRCVEWLSEVSLKLLQAPHCNLVCFD